MNTRERMMAMAIGALALLWILSIGWNRFQAAVAARQNGVIAAREARDAAGLAEAQGFLDRKQLTEWQAKSLPEDIAEAQLLYEGWLNQTLRDEGLNVTRCEPQNARNSSDEYDVLEFRVEASGDLREVVGFQLAFERAPMLHKITSLSIRPAGDRGDLEVSMRVEAISIPGALATDSLPEASPDSLAMGNQRDFLDPILSRDIFQRYSAQRRETPPVDISQDLVISLLFAQGEQASAGIKRQSTGEITYVGVGENFSFAARNAPTYSGRVESIGHREMIISMPDSEQLYRVGLFETFSRARPVGGPDVDEEVQDGRRGQGFRGGGRAFGTGRGGRGGRGRGGRGRRGRGEAQEQQQAQTPDQDGEEERSEEASNQEPNNQGQVDE